MTNSSDDTDRSDDEDEFELERAYDREELAAVFREFATAFESGRPVRLNGDDRTVRIAVPERVVAEFEAERDADAEPPVGELELELEWDDPDGSSVQIADRDADDAETGQAQADTAEADPAAAVLPLEGITDRSGRAADTEAEPEADVAPENAAEESTTGGRTSRFEVYEDKAGQWRWRLVHWNGNIVADSGEGYASRSNAERAARSVMRSAPTASIERRE